MIKIYKFGQVGEVCDASPFCVKVEAYLRLVDIPYESLCGAQYLRKAPKGKLPYIEYNGKIIADSTFIIDYINENYARQPDAELSATEKAIAHAFIKMLDENLYWVLVHARWGLEHNKDMLNKLFFGGIPFPLNKIISYQARKDVLNKLKQQGMGRHTLAEITEIGARDLQALADFLETKNYFFGDSATTLDAVAYAMLSQLLLVPEFTAPIFEKAKTYSNLVAFTERFHTRYFSQ